jgi:MFS family permease
LSLPRVASVHTRVRSSRRYPQLLLATCLVGMYSTTFTATVFSVAVKVVADDLDSTPQVVAWVVTAPLLAQAVAMPVLGRLGDIRGHRRVYLTGFSLAVVLCLATAAAWSAPSLIVLRTLAQVAGTATVPASFALLFRAFPPDQRVRAAAWASSTLAGASVTGLAFGGVIVDSVGWRPLFVIQAGLAALALLPATVVIEPDDEREPVTLDRAGAVALAVAAFSLAFGANRAAVWGPHPVVLALAAMLPAVCWLLVRIERVAPAPILPLELLRRRDMRVAGAASFLIQGSHMGSFIITPLLLQSCSATRPRPRRSSP